MKKITERTFCDLCGREILSKMECAIPSNDGLDFFSLSFKADKDGKELDLCTKCALNLMRHEIPEQENME